MRVDSQSRPGYHHFRVSPRTSLCVNSLDNDRTVSISSHLVAYLVNSSHHYYLVLVIDHLEHPLSRAAAAGRALPRARRASAIRDSFLTPASIVAFITPVDFSISIAATPSIFSMPEARASRRWS